MLFFKSKEKLNIESLRSVFETQKNTLLTLGYPALLGMTPDDFTAALENTWKLLSEKVADIEITVKGNIPLLIVVEQGVLQEKIKKIHGHTELDLHNIKKTENASLSPFSILLDVEDGRKMIAKSPKDALKKFEKEHRFSLTINESIALLTHYPELLKNHYLISAGSFYSKEQEPLPLLWLLDEHGRPELHYAWFHIAHGSYGTASYKVKF